MSLTNPHPPGLQVRQNEQARLFALRFGLCGLTQHSIRVCTETAVSLYPGRNAALRHRGSEWYSGSGPLCCMARTNTKALRCAGYKNPCSYRPITFAWVESMQSICSLCSVFQRISEQTLQNDLHRISQSLHGRNCSVAMHCCANEFGPTFVSNKTLLRREKVSEKVEPQLAGS